MVRDDLVKVTIPYTLQAQAAVDTMLAVLIARVPPVCPSGFDWTTGDIEQWLRDIRNGMR